MGASWSVGPAVLPCAVDLGNVEKTGDWLRRAEKETNGQMDHPPSSGCPKQNNYASNIILKDLINTYSNRSGKPGAWP